ncbi:MAG TPA: primosomal protein N' [Pyrinomonadaceae bacterium]|nr:primosomal protein N' [Pyrinomonadaceae bacterium]
MQSPKQIAESHAKEPGENPSGSLKDTETSVPISEPELTPEPANPNKSSDEPSRYANVALPVHVNQTFTYSLPPNMQEVAQPGARILVPFGRKLIVGYIVSLHERSEERLEIKEAEELIDAVPLVSSDVLELTRWVSDYYAAPWGEVLRAALPPGISQSVDQVLSLTEAGSEALAKGREQETKSQKLQLMELVAQKDRLTLKAAASAMGQPQALNAARALEQAGWLIIKQQRRGATAKEKTQRAVRLLSNSPTEALREPQRRVIDTLERAGGTLSAKELLRQAQVSESTIKTLQKHNLVELFQEAVRRDPLAEAALPERTAFELTAEQAAALSEIESQLAKHEYSTFLLHGVTGSGKTEIYIRAMRTALASGHSAMMLVPEIALTPVFSRRLRSEFGDRVAIFHSSLSAGERFDEWTRVRNGEARIVIGTRSAVFAPVTKLGLVIVDEEHEATYRQQESPHYNARDTAIVRAQKAGAVVVLGSATPSLESYHNAHLEKYRYLSLPNRIGGRPLAKARLIDMRSVFAKHGKPRVFSDQLLEAIEETHARGEQSIILLNRRGYSSFVLCRTCGDSMQCENCDVTLTYHRSERVVVCHYCNFRRPAPNVCPSCSGKYIYYVGEGTEQLEEMLGKLFPNLRLARIDRDTTARRSVFENSLFDFSEGRLDMLVGTQILAKGHDFPNVTLVGVVSVDAGLALPDFRSAERTFQLLTQVAGRAGRGDLAGQVLIQTYHPDHYALLHACAQDYEAFYEEEIRYRNNHSYPPFVALASLLVHGPEINRARESALEVRKELDAANPERECRVLGPAPAPLARLKGEHRIQLLIKSRSRRRLRQVIDTAITALAARSQNTRSINIEIDPISVM